MATNQNSEGKLSEQTLSKIISGGQPSPRSSSDMGERARDVERTVDRLYGGKDADQNNTTRNK